MCNEEHISDASDYSTKMPVDLDSVRDCSLCLKCFKFSFYMNLEKCHHLICKVCLHDRHLKHGCETCPICGSPVPERQLDLLRSCIRDSNDYPDGVCFEKVYQSSGGILVRKAEGTVLYLAVLQKMKDGDLQWVSPKGRIEDGENSLQAAKREVREEVGLKTLTLVDFVSKQSYSFRESDKWYRKTVFWYLFEVDRPDELALNEEEGFVEDKWITYEETFSVFSHESFVEVIKIADRIFKDVDC